MKGDIQTFKIGALLALLVISASSCRTRSSLQQRFKQSAELLTETRDIKSGQQLVMEFNFAEDSSQESYYVRIFPVDTFQFSAVDGYRGRASQIVIKGKSERSSQLISNSVKMEEKLSSKDSLSTAQTDQTVHDRSTKSEAKPAYFLSALVWILLGLLIGVFVFFRLMRYRGL